MSSHYVLSSSGKEKEGAREIVFFIGIPSLWESGIGKWLWNVRKEKVSNQLSSSVYSYCSDVCLFKHDVDVAEIKLFQYLPSLCSLQSKRK